ncbi:hypothetical protein L596_000484 [Steinernema carpocapsae]|uniref:Uncharacterized protein n=1 Tax=Steinernema carpocapsae TaxID=34508 RepID=A0A4U8UII9_STECR|nr:hypothetical protein L596_000484 [Steinernema carpocapsae]
MTPWSKPCLRYAPAHFCRSFTGFKSLKRWINVDFTTTEKPPKVTQNRGSVWDDFVRWAAALNAILLWTATQIQKSRTVSFMSVAGKGSFPGIIAWIVGIFDRRGTTQNYTSLKGGLVKGFIHGYLNALTLKRSIPHSLRPLDSLQAQRGHFFFRQSR